VTGDRISESRYATREGERFVAAGEADATHPVTAKVNGFDGVKFYLTARIDPGKGRVLAKLSDGSPLLVEHRIGAGRVLVFASTLDNIANDLPLRASFVPFLEQSAHFLSGFEATPANFVVDSFVDLRAARDAATAVDVVDPSGGRALSLKEAAKAEAFRLTSAGFYEVRRGNNRNELIAVHSDRRESDLDTVPKETLALWQGTGAANPSGGSVEAGEGQKPYSLWWYFALALLVASFVESLFSSRYLEAEEQPRSQVRKQAA
jgi:hypothetical protein